jgi:hypothetical protein
MSADQVRSGSLGVEVPLDQVRCDPHTLHAHRRLPAATLRKPRDAVRGHQPLDPLAADADPVLEPQLGVDPPGAIGAPRLRVDPADPLKRPRVLQLTVRRRAGLPRVKPGP